MRIAALACVLLTVLQLVSDEPTYARSSSPIGDGAVAESGEVSAPDPATRASSDVVKLLGVSLAGAEFSHDRQPGRLNFDYVYPGDGAAYRYYAARGFSIVRLPFLWERV
jgi:hypothetical protein